MKAIDYLVEWANDANWKRHIVNKVVVEETNIDVELLNKEIINIVYNDIDIEQIIQQSTADENNLNLRINSIKRPENINALSEDSNFYLGEKLNVFYGENGTGKSSFVKIFRKLASNYFTNEKDLSLHSNVYKKYNDKINQSIEITYEVNQNVKTEKVDINSTHELLKNINVFDSDSIVPLLNENLSFSILPQGFNYFQHTITILDKLKSSFEKAILEYKRQKDNLFIDSSFQIVRNEITYIQETVKPNNLLEYITGNYPKNEKYEIELEKVDAQISELTSINIATSKRLLKAQKFKLESINKAIGIVSLKLNEENLENVNRLIDEFVTKVAEEKIHNEKFNNQISYLEEFNDEWLSFIRSGKLYYKSLGKERPIELEQCIFCSQLLGEKQIENIESNFKHIDSIIIQNRDRIQKELLSNDINELKIIFNQEDKELIEKEVLASKIQSVVTLINMNMELFSKQLMEKKKIDISLKVDFSSLTHDIKVEIEHIDERLRKLELTSLETGDIVRRLEDKKNSLIKSEVIINNIDLFLEWFEITEQIKKLNKIKTNLKTNSLTKKSQEAFNALVEEDYLKKFKENCKELKVRDIDVKLKPQKGKTYRSKYISNEKYKLTDIMSEGEQKAIAMAEFATDLNIRKNYNTIIFDDPVTSLDYKRTEIFAKLIYNLSVERQVIVFTHNILFYYFLYNLCKPSNNKENKFFKVESFDYNNKGIVSESFSGRIENISDIKGKLNNYSQKISSKTCMGDELEYNISLAYTEIRTWCELIVEDGFFKNIIRRYEPNISFTKLNDIDSSFTDELQKVSDLFNRSCRWMIGHSQPLDTLYSKPDRDDFFSDLEYIKILTNKFTTVKWQ